MYSPVAGAVGDLVLAQVTGRVSGDLIHTLGDVHLYLNHVDQARTQLGRSPYALPRMRLNPDVQSLFDFTAGDFTLEDYRYHPPIAAPIAV